MWRELFWYTGMEMDFWTYHTKGDPKCEACAEPPTSCLSCEGLIHTQFSVDVEDVQDKFDVCGSDVTFASHQDSPD